MLRVKMLDLMAKALGLAIRIDGLPFGVTPRPHSSGTPQNFHEGSAKPTRP